MRRRRAITAEEAAANRRHAMASIRRLNAETLGATDSLISSLERAVELYPWATRALAHEGADLVEDMGHGPAVEATLTRGPAVLRDLLDALRAHSHRARQLADATEVALAREESGHPAEGA